MGFLDNVQTFAKGVGAKVQGGADVVSLTSQVATAQKELTNLYTEIGKTYYEAHRDDADETVKAIIESATAKIGQIEQLKKQIEETKAAAAAVQLVDNTPKPVVPMQGQPMNGQAPVMQPQGTKFCTSCGSPIALAAKFCTACGSAQPELNAQPTPVAPVVESVAAEATAVVEPVVEAAEAAVETVVDTVAEVVDPAPAQTTETVDVVSEEPKAE